MSNRSKQAKIIQESIRQILFEDWDPICINGFALNDEYDSYVGGIYRLLASGGSEHQIIERLYQIETINMGLEGDRERLKPIAAKLIRLNISL